MCLNETKKESKQKSNDGFCVWWAIRYKFRYN